VDTSSTIRLLEREMRSELTTRVLPFWSTAAVDPVHGGFTGYMGADGVAQTGAPRGGILNARILWAFSAAHRVLDDPQAGQLAMYAAEDFRRRFLDPVHGGVYWMIEPSGRPLDDRKHIYAQAFGIYALAEHHRATGDRESLRLARELFGRVEERAYDPATGGYHEAFTRDWTPLADVRLGDGDLDAPRSTNTHLHLLEAYTTLCQVWRESLVEGRLRSLIDLFDRVIVDRSTGHTRPFFDRDWRPVSGVVSFGHDMETAWLVRAAADVLGVGESRATANRVARLLADTVLGDGLDPLGGVYYQAHPGGHVDREKEWWTQAEAVVGFLDAYQATARPDFLAAARDTWVFIRSFLLDRDHGEWYRRTDRDGVPQPQHEKVGPWKGPYHNTRACLEVVERSRLILVDG
jgi:cellobiose epimerase